NEERANEMDFMRFDDCIIANLSLQEYYSKHGPTVALVFMTIVDHNLQIGSTISYRTWQDWQDGCTIEWADKPVAKFDILRILLRIDTNGISLRYRMNSYPITCGRAFDFPPGFQSAYLAISGSDIFYSEDNTCKIAIMDTQQMLQWMAVRKKTSISGQGRAMQSSKTQYRPPVVGSLRDGSPPQRTVPKCLFCFDNDVEVLFLPCAHAMCCGKCKENWRSHAPNLDAVKFLNKRQKVECPVCRREVTATGRIWFHHKSCVFCGCYEMNAVAAGRDGCGCVLGCYKKATEMLQKGKKCPVCGKEIVEILNVFIQSDNDFKSF
uniref:RING-type domain-containing protein n=1 Tax=Parascaris univalens TaxID=6257 RepID=A0A915A946_PARUN